MILKIVSQDLNRMPVVTMSKRMHAAKIKTMTSKMIRKLILKGRIRRNSLPTKSLVILLILGEEISRREMTWTHAAIGLATTTKSPKYLRTSSMSNIQAYLRCHSQKNSRIVLGNFSLMI